MDSVELNQLEKEALMQGKINALSSIISRLEARIEKLEVENQKLRRKLEKLENLETEKPQKLQPKKMLFRLPEAFSDYQKECDELLESLSSTYQIKKGKWSKDVLQWVLTPTKEEQERLDYPAKWRWGLYLQPSSWSLDRVSLKDPDEWEDYTEPDIYQYADNNGIELT